jgi:hypothetical protein
MLWLMRGLSVSLIGARSIRISDVWGVSERRQTDTDRSFCDLLLPVLLVCTMAEWRDRERKYLLPGWKMCHHRGVNWLFLSPLESLLDMLLFERFTAVCATDCIVLLFFVRPLPLFLPEPGDDANEVLAVRRDRSLSDVISSRMPTRTLAMST